MAANDVPCCETMFWVYLMISASLVLFAGIMSGLTLGLMSLSLVDLEVLTKAGQPEDRKNAGLIFVLLFNSFISCICLKYHLLLYVLYSWWQQKSYPLLRTNTCSCVPSSYAMPWQWRYFSFIESMAIGCFKIWLIYSRSLSLFLHSGFAHFPWCTTTSLGCYIDIRYTYTCIWWGNFLDEHSVFWNLFDCW